MITIIGDCHGHTDTYLSIARNSEYSLQLGDFGFLHSFNKLVYSGLDHNKHKVLLGNHDDYDHAFNVPYVLGGFGTIGLDSRDIFYIRGGISIDRAYRIGDELNGSRKSYWSQEELNFDQMLECMDMYRQVKPDIVVSHVPCATASAHILGNKSGDILQKFKFHKGFKENTQLLGDQLLKIHRPKIWLSGHLHASKDITIDGTRFVGLDELEVFML
jgi:predicted phosphodiesterase